MDRPELVFADIGYSKKETATLEDYRKHIPICIIVLLFQRRIEIKEGRMKGRGGILGGRAMLSFGMEGKKDWIDGYYRFLGKGKKMTKNYRVFSGNDLTICAMVG